MVISPCLALRTAPLLQPCPQLRLLTPRAGSSPHFPPKGSSRRNVSALPQSYLLLYQLNRVAPALEVAFDLVSASSFLVSSTMQWSYRVPANSGPFWNGHPAWLLPYSVSLPETGPPLWAPVWWQMLCYSKRDLCTNRILSISHTRIPVAGLCPRQPPPLGSVPPLL